jgi:hypothetical protein
MNKLRDTISIHRHSRNKVLYTVSALDIMSNGDIVDFADYKDSLLVSKWGSLQVVPITLDRIIQLKY